MTTFIEKIRLYKQEYNNGKKLDTFFNETPFSYIQKFCNHLAEKSLINHSATEKANISKDMSLLLKENVEYKTRLLKTYHTENAQNKLSYWGAVFDSVIKFLASNSIQNVISFPNHTSKTIYSDLIAEAKKLIPVLYREKPTEEDWDINIGGAIYIRDYLGAEPSSTKHFKHVLVSDIELKAMKRLMEILHMLPAYFNMQYNVSSTANNIAQSVQNQKVHGA